MTCERELEAIITSSLVLEPARAVPEILLWQAAPDSRLRRLAVASGGRSPYWAYQWAGGTALARFVLDRPETVAGRRVLDLGCGGGLVAIAAMKAGAAHVAAVDVDPVAVAATALNCAANGVQVEVDLADLLDASPPDVDLVLVGDLFYAPQLARRVAGYLARCCADGVEVLVGDPYRAHLPLPHLRRLAEMDVPDFGGSVQASGVFAFERSPLLPSREKVSAKPVDEGASALPRRTSNRRKEPLIRPSGTFSRKGRRQITRCCAAQRRCR